MELQGAASRLRSQCAQREADNRSLTELLQDREEQLFQLRADQLLLQKTVLVWSSYHSLFTQPLFETWLALGKCQCEAQQLLIHGMLRDQQRKRLHSAVVEGKRVQEKAALRTQVQRLQEQNDSNDQQHAAMEVRLERVSEESQRAQQQVSALQKDLARCMKRLEESERELEHERVQRHLLQHEAALPKTRRNVVNMRQYEDEILSRDAVIAHLQQAVREMNVLVAQQQSSRSEKTDGVKTLPPYEAEEKQLTASSRRLRNDTCDFEGRLHQCVKRLRHAVENEDSSSTHRRPLFVYRDTLGHPSASLSASPWAKEPGDGSCIGLQDFLAQELQAPLL
ncbi:hypothetical protein TraAM80_06901 [Trypanosoma rangeli]|uniref:Uncharacterized protein n=1 Tax=Trypanosoma rangeli TaxID=5698 RepID=A0A3R7KUN8_TRYRA|nr:uncharacterized protein TraAM80_06901 [Trypanosoma rangeli]RNF01717.1 hypothetical protein TraAM80_06901 [Trypanosoma rangeli]|eukprot:RNF01717.1 hypothetical protein TraAM80_06901 [Trypanosoma rangeli]